MSGMLLPELHNKLRQFQRQKESGWGGGGGERQRERISMPVFLKGWEVKKYVEWDYRALMA